MKLTVFQGDITCLNVDAVVNAANRRMLGGGGVDGAIHNAAGPRLKAACARMPADASGTRCPIGEARITPGFDLPAKVVIHTVGPVYDKADDPAVDLESCYRESLTLAQQYRHRTVAFAAISCGVYGYPPNEAAAIAVSVAQEPHWDFDEVIFVAFEDDVRDAFQAAVDGKPVPAPAPAPAPPAPKHVNVPTPVSDVGTAVVADPTSDALDDILALLD